MNKYPYVLLKPGPLALARRARLDLFNRSFSREVAVQSN